MNHTEVAKQRKQKLSRLCIGCSGYINGGHHRLLAHNLTGDLEFGIRGSQSSPWGRCSLLPHLSFTRRNYLTGMLSPYPFSSFYFFPCTESFQFNLLPLSQIKVLFLIGVLTGHTNYIDFSKCYFHAFISLK
jgi:hypothetical protein